jgi:protein TonB
MVILIGVSGFRPPAMQLRYPHAEVDQKFELADLKPIEPVVPQTTAEPEEVDTTEELPETPQVVIPVAADTPAVQFAVPVIGAPTVVVPPRYAAPAPVAPPKRVVAAAPPKPKIVTTTGKGGHYPQPPYPDLALRRGLQGSVVVEFTVDEAGLVTGAEVKNSSGHTLLDDHCLEWVRKKFMAPAGESPSYWIKFSFVLK